MATTAQACIKQTDMLQQSPEELHNTFLGMVGHSDQFISSPSPLATTIIISGPLTTAIMKLSVKKRWQLRHPVYYLKVRKSPTQHGTSLAMQHKY